MKLAHIREILRTAFSPKKNPETDEQLQMAIREKRKAGNSLLVAGATIAAMIDGHNDIHRAVVEATDGAGDFE